MNTAHLMNPPYIVPQFLQIHLTVNRSDRLRIHGLNTDFQLNQPRTHPFHQSQFLLCQKICRNLKMKVCHPVVMLQQIAPDSKGMAVTAVKGTIHKLYLSRSCIQKVLQFFEYQLQIPKSDLLLNGGKTVAAGKGTAPGGFVINDSVFKVRQPMIGKGKHAEVKRLSESIFVNFRSLLFLSLRKPEHRTRNLLQASCSFDIVPRQKPEALLPLPPEDSRKLTVLKKKFPGAERRLRPSQPNRNTGQNLCALPYQLPDLLHIPDITGKQKDLRLPLIDLP